MSEKYNLVFGVGINDANYVIQITKNKDKWVCPYFVRWHSMIRRCYSSAFHKAWPTYTDCEVCDEWHSLMSFRSWMMKQEWEGTHLDKDIIRPGNKIYSPESCAFVSEQLNTILNSCTLSRGKLPQGVDYQKRSRTYRARVHVGGKSKYVGGYKTPKQAAIAYAKEKSKIIIMASISQSDHRIRLGMIAHAKLLVECAESLDVNLWRKKI